MSFLTRACLMYNLIAQKRMNFPQIVGANVDRLRFVIDIFAGNTDFCCHYFVVGT